MNLKEKLALLRAAPIADHIWNKKYRLTAPDGTPLENSLQETWNRILDHIGSKDQRILADGDILRQGLFTPAGRVIAGAGTDRRVTMINCFVAQRIPDSLDGIFDTLKHAALTMQQGGGIGMDFSPLRPAGAIVKSTGSVSSGVIPFMRTWDAMCQTIMSAGSRRGAMMATLRDDHPDIPHFIGVKHDEAKARILNLIHKSFPPEEVQEILAALPGELQKFNLSILISHSFMEAVQKDMMWDLGHKVPPADENIIVDEYDVDEQPWYVYKRLPARELWRTIMESTFEHSEPGVIFIDEINDRNNLGYIESIRCVNPCGEEPLPAHGACDLGAVNLALMVNNPFTDRPEFDFDLLEKAVTYGIRFLDCVLDETLFPLEEQKEEAFQKRRVGLGVMGLGNVFQQFKIQYGSRESVDLTHQIMEKLRDLSYTASAKLAREKGSFPLFDADKFLSHGMAATLPEEIKDLIREHGIRNGVLNTIAPTGTTALLHGNVSGGVEPPFSLRYTRKILQDDGTNKEFIINDFGYSLYTEIHGETEAKGLPPYMRMTANHISVDSHLEVQAACQRFIDASISKTINVPSDITYDEFREIYRRAHELGMKGTTTYRPTLLRGSVMLETEKEETNGDRRGFELPGKTYKIKWHDLPHAMFVTINDEEFSDGTRRPFEIFINTKNQVHLEWTTALTRVLSAAFRELPDVSFLIEELKQVFSLRGGQRIQGVWYDSVVALIGGVIEYHYISLGLLEEADRKKLDGGTIEDISPLLTICPKCGRLGARHQNGCEDCIYCDYSECGV